MPGKDDWYSFVSCIEFETVDCLFSENQMPQSHVDRLMQLWMASMLQDDDWAPYTDHADLHQVIDAISHGDVSWKYAQVQFKGNIPASQPPHWMQQTYNIWLCDPNTVVANLLSNPDFYGHFDYIPYHEFEPSGEHRLINGQDTIARDHVNVHGVMLVPIILGTDKTTVLAMTGQHDYYPLYLSIGNTYNNT
ncbi:hypothetical protein J3A83DRAFT_4356299 [Scleroderma citrinum]